MFTSFLNPEKFLHLALYLPITLTTIMFLVNVNILKNHEMFNFHLTIFMHKIDHLMFSKISFFHSCSYRSVFAKPDLVRLSA